MSKIELITKLPLPDHWGSWSYGEEFSEVQLKSISNEYKNVAMLLREDALHNLQRVTRVENPYLYWRYQLRKMEYELKTSSAVEW